MELESPCWCSELNLDVLQEQVLLAAESLFQPPFLLILENFIHTILTIFISHFLLQPFPDLFFSTPWFSSFCHFYNRLIKCIYLWAHGYLWECGLRTKDHAVKVKRLFSSQKTLSIVLQLGLGTCLHHCSTTGKRQLCIGLRACLQFQRFTTLLSW